MPGDIKQLLRRSSSELTEQLFGLRSIEELPELEQWDPSPEDQAALRDRLLRAGDERSGAVGAAG